MFATKYGSKIREMILDILLKIRNFINKIWQKFGAKRNELQKARAYLVKILNKVKKRFRSKKIDYKIEIPSVLTNPEGLHLLIKSLNRGVELSLSNFELLFIAINNRSDIYSHGALNDEMNKAVDYIKNRNYSVEINLGTIWGNIEDWIKLIDVFDSCLYKIDKMTPRILNALKEAEDKLKNKETKEEKEDPEERELLSKYRKTYEEMMQFTHTVKFLIDDVTKFTNTTLKVVVQKINTEVDPLIKPDDLMK